MALKINMAQIKSKEKEKKDIGPLEKNPGVVGKV